ncbi:MAG: peptidoglycan editing factor PgeF [Gaiellales bacterium]|nr:MAG: peptidoglycan editing factor PgeF [Gaiellales bacterium]
MNDLLKKYLNLDRDPFHREEWGHIDLWEFDRAVKGVRVYFTTRSGGVSEHPYRSLNLGFHVGDARERVIRNRELLGGHFGFPPERLTSPRQRHSDVVRELGREQDVGDGADGRESAFSPFDPCDGLVTSMERAPLLLLFADCVPVVVTARSGGRSLVAVIHAGRAGLVAGVVANGVRRLRETAAAELEKLTAAIGPSIGPCCYEVDAAAASAFAARFGSEAVQGRNLDLRLAARRELERAGVGAGDVHLLDICTACDQDFYSYRRDGVTGRQGALAWIE